MHSYLPLLFLQETLVKAITKSLRGQKQMYSWRTQEILPIGMERYL